MTALGYDRWENFSKVIHKGSIACDTSDVDVANHFVASRKWSKSVLGPSQIIAIENIQNMIFTVRGVQVMVDSALGARL